MRKALAGLLLVPSIACAEFWTGNDFYLKATSTSPMDNVHAMGYAIGVYDVAVHVTFCPGTERGITVGQITDMAKNWLANNPHRRNESAEKLLRESFKQAWPCAQQPKRGA